MVNQEILEGLRTALSRGYPLESAMMSFFNAGYKKEEIEDAARALYTHPSHPLSHPGKATPEELKKPTTHKTQRIDTHVFGPSEAEQEEAKEIEKEKEKEKSEPEKPGMKPKPLKPAESAKPKELEEKEEKEKPTKAEVSKYEEKTKPKGKLITILLIILLFLMVSGLVSIFVFKEQLADFFANMFG